MVGEVVADQGVEQVGVAAQVGVGEGDELAVPGRGGAARPPGPGGRRRPAASSAAATSSDRGVVGPARAEDLGGGVGVAADQPAEQGGRWSSGMTVERSREALTIR